MEPADDEGYPPYADRKRRKRGDLALTAVTWCTFCARGKNRVSTYTKWPLVAICRFYRRMKPSSQVSRSLLTLTMFTSPAPTRTPSVSTLFSIGCLCLAGTPRQLIRDVDGAVTFSPDGTHFAFSRGESLRTDLASRSASWLLKPTGPANGYLRHALETFRRTFWKARPGLRTARQLHFQPMSQRKTKAPRGMLSAISVSDGSVREIYSTPGTLGRPRWLPDGSALLVPMGDRPWSGGG